MVDGGTCGTTMCAIKVTMARTSHTHVTLILVRDLYLCSPQDLDDSKDSRIVAW